MIPLKKFIPTYFKAFLLNLFTKRIIKNYFKSNFEKKVLISYIIDPFKKDSYFHTNYFEATSAAKIFNELGYQVDVMNYDSNIPDLKSYDVIYGFGDVFQKYFESDLIGKKTILYATGMHVCHQNTITLKRIKDVFIKRGKWLSKSGRFVEKTWSHQTLLVDGIIALGNDKCKNSYEKYYDGDILALPAPFYKVIENVEEVIVNRTSNARLSFLWFGSSGLIHKGLDLCLEYFSQNDDLTLHICGNIFQEQEFVTEYENELFNKKNVHVHGLVDIKSAFFKEILLNCSFCIYPSCSEGGAPSVLTVVGNGGLIPIITYETSVSTGYEIYIDDFTEAGINKAVNIARNLSEKDFLDLQFSNAKYVEKNNSQFIYYTTLRKSIDRLLNN